MKNACFAATIALLSGCSLINSLDSVKPEASDDAGSGGNGGKGGKGSGGRATDGGAGGSLGGAGGEGTGGESAGGESGMGGGTDAGIAGAATVDSGAGGGAAGGTDGGGGTVDGGNFTPGGPNGAIVVYDAKEQKTFVLDPTDGHAVASAASPVYLAIVNDPATDYWYAFRQVAAVGGPTQLLVKELNTTTGEFRDIGKAVTVPTPITPTIGVLNQRLAYLSYPTGADPTASTFTVLDTTDVGTIFVRSNQKALPAGGKVALTARGNASDVGGSVSIVITNAQTGAACIGGVCNVDVSVLGETITGNTIKEDTTPTAIGAINPTGGSVGFASTETTDPAMPRDIVLMPPLVLPGATPAACEPTSLATGSAFLLDANHGRTGSAVSFDCDGLRINSAAYDPCSDTAFGTSLLGDTAIWAIPMSSSATPTAQKVCSTTGGGALFYDRYSKGLVRVVTKSGGSLELYDLDSTDPNAPKLKARTLKLPAPFAVQGVIAVRRSNVCK
ncbi:MAG TPA: hypothetical protein VH062_19790 [Polyangiaceae bacterium]|jgi:hypothetical protein|nr:hypothetical protein [Polyangiaceae bacterium]